MRWLRYVARMGEERKVFKVPVESSKERDHLKDRGIGGRLRSKLILRRLTGRV
jgi:hypothetical protein